MITAKGYVLEVHSESLLGRDSSFDLEIIKQVNVVALSQPHGLDSKLISGPHGPMYCLVIM